VMNGVPWWFFQVLVARWPAGTGGRCRRRDCCGDPASFVGCGACQLLGRSTGIIRHHFSNGLILGEPSGDRSGTPGLARCYQAGLP
jgi:2-dehydropantoate 2-reductase